MVKFYISMVLCSTICFVHAGNVLTCLGKTAEGAEKVVAQEIANGDAKLLAEYIAGKAVPKLLANADVQKFTTKTGIQATQDADGGYTFSVAGIPVAQAAAQQDPTVVVSTLVPHIASAIATAKNAQASAPALSSQS